MLGLYQAAAAKGTLGRDAGEYNLESASSMIREAIAFGFCIGALSSSGSLVGEVHGHRLQPRRFAHVFSGLTAAVHPTAQGQGLGRRLFVELLARVDALLPSVTRIELMLQAGNPAALHLYEALGFELEGVLRRRVQTPDGKLLDDLYMARLRSPSIRSAK